MINTKKLLALVSAGLLAAGCMSTPKSDIEPDWLAREEARDLSPVYVLHDGERIAFSTGRNVYLLDGADGRVVNSLEESWLQALGRTTSVTVRGLSATAGQFMAANYDIKAFGQHNMLLLFDYQANREVVIAMDSVNGEILWRANDLEFSLNKYEALIDRGADMIGRGLANLLGAEHEGEDRETRRARQIRFLDTVVHAVPDSNYLVFKTFDGLYILDPRSGERLGHVANFRGAGIADVMRVDDDIVVVSGAQNIDATLGLATAYDIVRTSLQGDVRWKAEHSGRKTMGLVRAGNVVLVNGGPTEAFDLSTGEKLWENEVSLNWPDKHHVLVDGDYVYFASDLKGRVGRVEESKIWRQHARTGAVSWETSLQRGYYVSFEKHGNNLVAGGSGRMYTGEGEGVLVLNAQSGELNWQSPQFEKASIFSTSQSLTAPIVVNDTVYAADLKRVYAFDLNSGAVKFQNNHADYGTNSVVGLYSFNDRLFMIGRDAVVAYALGTGEWQQTLETERSASHKIKGDRIVLSNGRGITQTVNMRTLVASPVVRHAIENRYFGDIDQEAYVTQNGRYKYTVTDEGYVARFSF